ncbi:outer membrane putative beta-barrel porin/alpha-amylase [Prosthecobacter fusiformis]|uniref:Outer membrane putative beta-barrel porin/alpha-amylase n=1 Tax=Prosthecobacter fusiformis TaxID=48464 RepID=A0A4R7SQ66_9BACT|nr:transporter [Prosthecobacter fusiformis]TDU81370.1 outer membrane putative beta-barrel porin/alpha-amylase [Prosthecobacter fusiformis]
MSDNLFLPALLMMAASLCHAGPPVTSPIAQAEVRPMSTDRPDTTESPFTVPAGMFQVEASFFDYNREHFAGEKAETWIWGQVNLKAGLAQDMDLQVIFDSYQEVKISSGGPTQRLSGFGDVTVRLKKNIWGNEGGQTALGVMPYVSIPTGTELSADVWEGGLIVPFSCALTERVTLGLMAQMDIVHDFETGGQDLEWVHSATLGFGLTDALGLYTELVGIAGQDAAYMGIFNTGLTFAVTDNLVFDAGVRIGLNRPAPDFGVFSGVSFRF